MKPSELIRLNTALKNVRTEADAVALSKMVIEIAPGIKGDVIWLTTEGRILAAVISYQAKRGPDRSFADVCEMLQSDRLDSILENEPLWRAVKQSSPDNFRMAVTAGLVGRLATEFNM